MIWFACQQCGKKHNRPESAIGTMVFCECGQGNIVPWDSTVEPAESPLPPPRPATPPRLEPIPVGEERRPPPLPRPERAPRPGRRRDAAHCFNHDEAAAEVECADCGEHFCRQCVLEFQGKTLCGPCKNQRVRNLTKAPRLSGLAIASALLAVIVGPVALMLAPLGTSANMLLVVILLAVVPQALAFLLGALALRAAETRPGIGGQSLAITGMVAAVVSSVLAVAVMFIRYVHWV